MHRLCEWRRALVVAMLLVLPSAGAAQLPRVQDTGLSMGGFARLHALLGDVSAGAPRSGDQKLYVPHIPVTERPDSDRWRATYHAKDSRIWFRTQTPTATDDSALETLFEFDLHDAAEGHRLRLRHAYAQFDSLLVGQTYTAFTNVSALADLDAAIAVGDSVTRHNVLRWTQPLGDASEWVVSLEEPLSRIATVTGDIEPVSGSRGRPDILIRWNQAVGPGNLSISGLSRTLRGLDPGTGERDRQQVSAFSVGGKLYTGPLDNIRFTLAHGRGWARYATPGTFFDALQGNDGRLDPARLTGGTLAWQHYWDGADWRSTAAYSQVQADLPARSAAEQTRRTRSAHLNLIRNWGQQVSLGLEYVYGHRVLRNGQRGQINRVQLTARLNFRARILP